MRQNSRFRFLPGIRVRSLARLGALGLIVALVFSATVTGVVAQTGIFSIFRTPQQQEDEAQSGSSPLADAEEDVAAYIATGAPLAIRPADSQLNRSPLANLSPGLPVPPERLTRVPNPAAAAPPPAPDPEPAAPPARAEPEPLPEPETSSEPRMLALLTQPTPRAMQVPILPQPSTVEDIEEEERKAPEPRIVEKQTDAVDIACLRPELMAVIQTAGNKFGAKPVITSGQRNRGRRGSYHRQCMAADFFIPGVARADLARYLRSLPGAGGVGTYCHTKSVHIDIGEPRNWWQCGMRMRFAQR
ncbi:Zn-DD-carboxypeptidase_like domain containing protein [Rhabdaerophilaceae bacterium]